jgi:hypothetical protein
MTVDPLRQVPEKDNEQNVEGPEGATPTGFTGASIFDPNPSVGSADPCQAISSV